MKTRLATIEKNLAILRTATANIVLPPDLPSHIITTSVDYSPMITCYIGAAPNQGGREQLLALFGELFGRNDWIRTRSYDNKTFQWNKDFHGVQILLDQAELIPLPVDKTPVAPTSFPILLGNVQESGHYGEEISPDDLVPPF